MIKYRPHRAHLNDYLNDSMELAKEFASLDQMYDYIVQDWNALENNLFDKSDLSVSKESYKDDRIDWKETRYVCTRRMGNDIYDTPQCIGMCSIE